MREDPSQSSQEGTDDVDKAPSLPRASKMQYNPSDRDALVTALLSRRQNTESTVLKMVAALTETIAMSVSYYSEYWLFMWKKERVKAAWIIPVWDTPFG